MKYSQKVHIGTSGWHYRHWKGAFYPENYSGKDFLAFYADHFESVEINNTFYKVPGKATLALWRKSVPESFIFSVKASRYITHMKKLKDSKRPLFSFLKKIDALDEKLGPVLFQLPPNWAVNAERLQMFLRILPGDYRYAFEFRDTSWFCSPIYEMLDDHGIAFCIYDLGGTLSPKEVTSDLIYIRLHGPDGPYKGNYSTPSLAGWAGAFSAWLKKGKKIYCYFDNDEKGFAAINALKLHEMVKG
jgi:uncharacterized protein YecE (DUF72 family)